VCRRRLRFHERIGLDGDHVSWDNPVLCVVVTDNADSGLPVYRDVACRSADRDELPTLYDPQTAFIRSFRNASIAANR
jgi:hypothetical protein